MMIVVYGHFCAHDRLNERSHADVVREYQTTFSINSAKESDIPWLTYVCIYIRKI